MTNFEIWYENADIPMQDERGFWYDAETGIYFINPPKVKKEKIQKPAQHEKMALKLVEMKRDAERVVLQENFLDRAPNDEVRKMQLDLINFAKELLSRNAKKAEFCKCMI